MEDVIVFELINAYMVDLGEWLEDRMDNEKALISRLSSDQRSHWSRHQTLMALGKLRRTKSELQPRNQA